MRRDYDVDVADVVVVAVSSSCGREYHVRVRLFIGETHVRMYSRAFSEHTRAHPHAVSRVYAVIDAPSASVLRYIGFRASRVHEIAHANACASSSLSQHTLRPVIALHTSVISASLSLPPRKSRCATVTYIRDSRRVRMSWKDVRICVRADAPTRCAAMSGAVNDQ